MLRSGLHGIHGNLAPPALRRSSEICSKVRKWHQLPSPTCVMMERSIALQWWLHRATRIDGVRCIAGLGFVNLIGQSYNRGFCVFLCTCLCVGARAHGRACVSLSRPLWSPLIPNLTDLLQRQPLMCCWIPLWNIGCCLKNIHFVFPCQEHVVWFSPPTTLGPSSRTGGCRLMSLFTIQVLFFFFLPALWSVILHLWALLIPFLSCVSLLIFDLNLKPPCRIGQHRLRGVQIQCMHLSQGPPGFRLLTSSQLYLCVSFCWARPVFCVSFKPHVCDPAVSSLKWNEMKGADTI